MDRSMTVRRIVFGALLWVAAIPMTSPYAHAQDQTAAVRLDIENARTVLSKYQDPMIAVHDGYLSTVTCMDYPRGSHAADDMGYQPGGMGVHLKQRFVGGHHRVQV